MAKVTSGLRAIRWRLALDPLNPIRNSGRVCVRPQAGERAFARKRVNVRAMELLPRVFVFGLDSEGNFTGADLENIIPDRVAIRSMAAAEYKRILILCKTYPSPSSRHVETSCVAGMDDSGQLVRFLCRFV
jgi:hypothetical protein